MIPKGVGGNKRSRSAMKMLEQKIRDLMYSENPCYSIDQIVAIFKISRRTYFRYSCRNWKEDEPKRQQELQAHYARMLQRLHDSLPKTE